MATFYFLRIDGIPGESRDPEQSGDIELQSFDWRETAGSGDEPVEAHFTARSSTASPGLFLACVSGSTISGAVLTMRDAHVVRRWRFSGVAVSDYSTSGSGSGAFDDVMLQAASVEALPPPQQLGLRFQVVRPDDLLNLEIETVNMRVDGPREDAALVVGDATRRAQLIVTFPSQTIAETAYFRASPVPGDNAPQSTRVPPAPGEREYDLPGITGTSTTFQRDGVARIASASRLVFDVPAGIRLPFTIEGVLDWSALELAVSPIAAIPPDATDDQVAAAPAIRPPEANETVLELPYRLVVSPNREVTWLHRRTPFASRGRTELWHTRLALRTRAGVVELSRAHPAPLRAIWSPDYDPYRPPPASDVDPDLGLTAMAPNDRHQLVILTSAFQGYEADVEIGLPTLLGGAGRLGGGAMVPITLTIPYVPEPFGAELLMLSPLGAWLRSRGHWNPPHQVVRRFRVRPDISGMFGAATANPAPLLRNSPLERRAALSSRIFEPLESAGEDLDLSEWVHVAAQGRDHYVRIVYEGELKPFKNRAALVNVTERKFVDKGPIVGAYLTQRMFIVVREPEKSFEANRAMPFKHIRLTTLVTPDIAYPSYIPGSRSFWVEVNTGAGTPTRFAFHGVGTDRADNESDFTVPMMFVSVADKGPVVDAVLQTYNETKNANDLAHRDVHIPGQKIAFAKPGDDPTKRNTQLVTESLNFVVDPKSGDPKLLKAEVKVPQVQDLLGTDAATTIRLYKRYIEHGFDAATGVFAEIVEPNFQTFNPADPLAGGTAPRTLGVKFSSDKAGGFATPNLGVSTLTRDLGPIAGDVGDAIGGSFNPDKFFGKGLAKLFGSFDLSDLLRATTLAANAPKMRTTTTPIQDGRRVETRIDWIPDLRYPPAGGIVTFTKDKKGQTKLEVHAVITRTVKLDATSESPSFVFTGAMNAFEIGILKSIFLTFVDFSFAAQNGQKPDVKVTLDTAEPLRFDGDLKFVDELRKAIPPDLFGDGPSLDISASGIRAGFAIGLPPLAVGVFSLKDVSLGAALTLPFVDGKPVVDFNVSRRDHPFLLAVAIFGGGGFFHLQLDAAGMKELEAALEFGATASLDIGVASGSVHMMAGIYFSLQRKEPNNQLAATLTGYLRIGGSLSVLGLVTVSVEFNLSFVYQDKGKAYGRATLTVHVEIAYFSRSVQLTVERTFGGQGGDPKFVDAFTDAGTWNEYATAFA